MASEISDETPKQKLDTEISQKLKDVLEKKKELDNAMNRLETMADSPNLSGDQRKVYRNSVASFKNEIGKIDRQVDDEELKRWLGIGKKSGVNFEINTLIVANGTEELLKVMQILEGSYANIAEQVQEACRQLEALHAAPRAQQMPSAKVSPKSPKAPSAAMAGIPEAVSEYAALLRANERVFRTRKVKETLAGHETQNTRQNFRDYAQQRLEAGNSPDALSNIYAQLREAYSSNQGKWQNFYATMRKRSWSIGRAVTGIVMVGVGMVTGILPLVAMGGALGVLGRFVSGQALYDLGRRGVTGRTRKEKNGHANTQVDALATQVFYRGSDKRLNTLAQKEWDMINAHQIDGKFVADSMDSSLMELSKKQRKHSVIKAASSAAFAGLAPMGSSWLIKNTEWGADISDKIHAGLSSAMNWGKETWANMPWNQHAAVIPDSSIVSRMDTMTAVPIDHPNLDTAQVAAAKPSVASSPSAHMAHKVAGVKHSARPRLAKNGISRPGKLADVDDKFNLLKGHPGRLADVDDRFNLKISGDSAPPPGLGHSSMTGGTGPTAPSVDSSPRFSRNIGPDSTTATTGNPYLDVPDTMNTAHTAIPHVAANPQPVAPKTAILSKTRQMANDAIQKLHRITVIAHGDNEWNEALKVAKTDPNFGHLPVQSQNMVVNDIKNYMNAHLNDYVDNKNIIHGHNGGSWLKETSPAAAGHGTGVHTPKASAPAAARPPAGAPTATGNGPVQGPPAPPNGNVQGHSTPGIYGPPYTGSPKMQGQIYGPPYTPDSSHVQTPAHVPDSSRMNAPKFPDDTGPRHNLPPADSSGMPKIERNVNPQDSLKARPQSQPLPIQNDDPNSVPVRLEKKYLGADFGRRLADAKPVRLVRQAVNKMMV